ncbi:hypothetical protein BC943DRAFT_318730 [Umbelopsis sp. AD052]|nr:hypothetical protein BC943DRAFT_318730 [Umbelopsis sp. AD052]
MNFEERCFGWTLPYYLKKGGHVCFQVVRSTGLACAAKWLNQHYLYFHTLKVRPNKPRGA